MLEINATYCRSSAVDFTQNVDRIEDTLFAASEKETEYTINGRREEGNRLNISNNTKST